MSDQDPGSHDSPYREREDNDANKDPSEQDNEYYQFLHISRQATEAEIHTAYKKLSLLYHPDKHLDEEKKKKAEILFQKLKKAYEVLSHPHKRAIYDCLGKKGLEEEDWEIVQRTKTPREIRDEYERIAKKHEEQLKQMRTNPTSNLSMTIDATDLFERYLYEEEYDEFLGETPIPTLEVSKISFGQTINCPLTNTDNIVLAGNVNTSNGTGSGQVSAAWTHVTPQANSYELNAGVGSGPFCTAKAFRKLTTKTFANMSGSMQFSPSGLKPAFELTFGNHLGEGTVGYVTYSSQWSVDEYSDEFILSEERSGMSTMVTHNTTNYYFMASLQLGIPTTYVVFSAVRKFQDPESKARAKLKFGTFGAILEYGVEKKITAHSWLGATMAVGVPVGVTLRIKLTRAQQTYLFPFHLSDEILMQPIFYGTVCPLLSYYIVKKLILDPIEARNKAAERQEQLQAVRERVEKARLEAEASVDLMRERYARLREDEEAKRGLVVVRAVYGKIMEDSEVLISSLDDLMSDGASESNLSAPSPSSSSPPSSSSVFTSGMPSDQVIDVTIPLQCLVEENSRITLYDGVKSELAGFYDPAPTDEEKHLVIRYLYQDQVHQVVIPDREPAKIPKTAHRISGR